MFLILFKMAYKIMFNIYDEFTLMHKTMSVHHLKNKLFYIIWQQEKSYYA